MSVISEQANISIPRNHSYNTTFIINTTPKVRQIREQQILGIDYDKLRSGSNKKNHGFSSNSLCSTPRDSLLKNQTATSFRPSTLYKSDKLNGKVQSGNDQSLRYSLNKVSSKHMQTKNEPYCIADNEDKTNKTNEIDSGKVDYEAFKKYQKEFQEFRRQKQMNQTASSGFSQRSSRIKRYQNQDENNRETKSQIEDKSLNNITLGKASERLYDSVKRSRLASEGAQPQVQQDQMLEGSDQQQQQIESSLAENTNNEGNNNITSQNGINNPTNNNNNPQLEKTQQSWRCQPQGQLQYDTNNDQSPCGVQFDQQSCCPSSSDPNYQSGYSKMVDKYVDRNSDYYKHLMGDCLCGHCICGKCRCPYKSIPFDLKRALQSNYQHDFSSPKSISPVPTISMPFFTQQQSLPTLNATSTNQNDFKPHEVKDHIYCKAPNTNKQTGPFLASSTYQSNFIDWQTKNVGHVRAPQDLTITADMPFVAKSLYADSYGKDKKPQKDKEFEDYIKSKSKSMFSSPMNPDFRFIPQSTSQQFFKRPTQHQQRADPLKPYQAEAELTRAIPDQFKSQSTRAYEDKYKVNCPSQLALMEMSKRLKMKKQSEFEQYTKDKEMSDKNPMTMNQLFATVKTKPQRILAL